MVSIEENYLFNEFGFSIVSPNGMFAAYVKSKNNKQLFYVLDENFNIILKKEMQNNFNIFYPKYAGNYENNDYFMLSNAYNLKIDGNIQKISSYYMIVLNNRGINNSFNMSNASSSNVIKYNNRDIVYQVNANLRNLKTISINEKELNKNKNHEKVLRAIAELKRDDVHYAIAGKGALADELTRLAEELGIAERVHILGYRDDVAELYGAADLFVHPSYREGLPVSVIEAMAAGLPVVASRIRGNVDLITEEGGRLVCPCNARGFAEAIDELLSDIEKSEKMGLHNREAAKNYSTEAVSELLLKLYG